LKLAGYISFPLSNFKNYLFLFYPARPYSKNNSSDNDWQKENIMTAQAFIFDLSAFRTADVPADAERLLDQAIEDGLPCALISELPHEQAGEQLRRRFGDTAHHIFSVVLTGADFEARGHKAPYSVVLGQLGVPPDDALAVTASPRAIAAARTARIGVQAPQAVVMRKDMRKVVVPTIQH
jgi:beta-phosphoglucomutase-like phosphatase (HAD superfamily)